MNDTGADIHFYFDPVCPFAWMASRWVEEVASQRHLTVDWRFIALSILNRDADYESQFPEGYRDGHDAGTRMLRLAARVRAEHGREMVGALYTALGERIWDIPKPDDRPGHQRFLGTREHVTPALEELDLPMELLDALDDSKWDEVIENETKEALGLTGDDVGTPIIHYRPPSGQAFFGPVISRVPRGEEAVELWDHVMALTAFDGFAEIKRSLRQSPDLQVFGGS